MNNLGDLIKDSVESLKGMVDVSNVVGEAVKTEDGTLVIPVTQISCGFGAGGSDIPSKNGGSGFGGGCGGGVKVSPVSFLVISGEKIRLIPANVGTTTVDKVLDLVPEMVDKVNNIFLNHKAKKEEND